ncbi:thioredoxin-disulfide reductase [Geminicoccus harenae]|uniref:thioredoxin-disulfide reductase n=1 Tax=Geminicoccus harenae TaxID=2498453 RepID=UPI00168B8F5E|nr:thioredoxin-disulfide reductase [Geminicoccus harenae]
MNERHAQVLVMGGGPAGYTAAIYAARANLKPVLIQGMQPGGQLSITTDVENYPGFAEAIQGPWLMEQMSAQAENCGTELVFDLVTDVDLSVRPFRLTLDGGSIFTCDALIVTTGAQARWLGIDAEQRFMGHGVSACATCDGFFFRGKRVVVVGGGNTAVEEALYLAGLAAHVTLVHRRNQLRAEKILQDRLFARPNVEVIWDSIVTDLVGTHDPKGVTGVVLASTKDGSQRHIPADGLFVAIGHDPATGLFRGKLAMDEEGYLLTERGRTFTSVDGVFAAGDVQDKIYRQAVTAAGSGCMAALDAERWLTARGMH